VFSENTRDADVIATPAAMKRLETLSYGGCHVLIPDFVVSRSRLSDRTQYLLHHSKEHSPVTLQPGTVHTAPSPIALKQLFETLPVHRLDELCLVLVPELDSALSISQGAIIDSNRFFRVRRIASSFPPISLSSPAVKRESQLRTLDAASSFGHRARSLKCRFSERVAGYRVAVAGQRPAARQTARELYRVGVRHLTLLGSSIQVINQRDEYEQQEQKLNGMGNRSQQSNRIASDARAEILRPRNRQETERSVSFPTDIFSYTTLQELKTVDTVLCVTNSVPVRLALAALCAAYLKPLTQISILPHHASKREDVTEHKSAGPIVPVDIQMAVPGSGCMNCLGGLPDIDVGWFDQLKDRGYVVTAHGGPESHLNWPVNFGADLVKDAVSLWIEFLQSSDGTGCRFRRNASGGWDRQCEQELHSASQTCPICRLTGVGDLGPERFFRMVHDLSYWQFKHANK
jgi:hypothetical protein